jgi:hypothetical protein
MINEIVPSSFRDPSGFIFCKDGSIYRQVNIHYKENYDHLVKSGLYQSLVDSDLLIPHEEVNTYAKPNHAYRGIRPEPIPFISYPYEWCFSQLKDAALTTLRIQKFALDFGMSLRDCSAYNIQFVRGKPILIDTLSFEKYREGEPWVAYRQFCQHFLAPLSLMCYMDVRLNQWSRIYIDGIPLDLTSSLLPVRAYLKFSLLLHIYLHAKSQIYYAGKSINKNLIKKRFTTHSFRGLVDHLESSIRKLRWRPKGTEWATYDIDSKSYLPDAMEHKKQMVANFLKQIDPASVWDLGANQGLFSRIAADMGIPTISFDIDPSCVEMNYLAAVARGEKNILPLVLDVTNPSPKIGWDNQERLSLLERGPADTVLALAFIHHLAISNNLPMDRIAGFFKKMCTSLIIEFIPKSDPKVQKLLSTREDVFPNYTKEEFEGVFSRLFTIKSSVKIKDSERTLYWMQAR